MVGGALSLDFLGLSATSQGGRVAHSSRALQRAISWCSSLVSAA